MIFLSEALPDIPRLFTAIAEFLSCLLFIIFAKRKYNNLKTGLISIAALGVFIGFHYLAGILPIYFWIPCMIIAAGLMFLFIYITCLGSIRLSLYNGITAFIIAEFSAAFEWWQYYFFSDNFRLMKSDLASVLFCIVTYVILFSIFLLLEGRYGKDRTNIAWKDIIGNLLVAVVIFVVSNISFVDWDTPMTSKYPLEIFYIRALVDFCGVVVLYSAREQRKYNNAKMELAQMHNLLVRQYQQYCITKGTIDSVNKKYHDLKHQLTLLSQNSNNNETKKSIDEINEEIKLYSAVYKTGNDVLDTILTSKASICVEKGIDLTCIADGNAISFMNEMDICSFFGNALDNAIESVEKIEDKDKRVINIKVYQQNMFVIVGFENYYEGRLLYENGELQSTKKNKLNNHGYGVKSIKSIAEKYGGRIKINTADNWFIVNAMIPISKKEASE